MGSSSESFQVGEHVETQGEWHPQRAWEFMPFPQTLCHLFHLAVSELYCFIINWSSRKQNVSLSSVGCSTR